MRKMIILDVIAAMMMSLAGCASKPAETAEKQEEFPLYGYLSMENDAERQLYEAIDAHAKELVPSEFTCDASIGKERIYEIKDIYCMDHPEVFWIDEGVGMAVHGQNDTEWTVSLPYNVTGKQLNQMQEEQEAVIADILSQVPENLSDYETEIFIHDWILGHCEYDREKTEEYYVKEYEIYAYGVLADHKAICEGYARAFMLLCQRCGIECVPVQGYDNTTKIGHIVNAVHLEDGWYYVDTTNDDNYDTGHPGSGYYCNITSEKLQKTFTVLPLYSERREPMKYAIYNTFIPECTAETYNRYRHDLPEYDTAEYTETIIPAAAEAAVNGEEWFVFRVTENADYEHFRNWLFEEGHRSGMIRSVQEYLNDEIILDTRSDGYYAKSDRVIGIQLSVREK